MIGLHLSAIAYYAIVLRIPLLGAMIFGKREIPALDDDTKK
jgi:hypothetical protein